jgi:hypothetical protein
MQLRSQADDGSVILRPAGAARRRCQKRICALQAGCRKMRIAIRLVFAQNPPMLAQVLSAAVNGIGAFPVEVEPNSGWGDTAIVPIMSFSPNP